MVIRAEPMEELTMHTKTTRKKLLTAAGASLGLALLSQTAVFAADGWQTDSNGQWYYTENDQRLKNTWVSWPDGTKRFLNGSGVMAKGGWINFENNRYYLDEQGVPYENQWFSVAYNPSQPSGKSGENWYYAGEGGAVYKNGFFEIGGKLYYFYSGANSPRKTQFVVDGRRYYATEDGSLERNGWFCLYTTNASTGAMVENWYYAKPDGELYANGWYEVDGVTCYFNGSGRSSRAGWVTVDGKRYYADENGDQKNDGWFSISGVNSQGKEYTNWYYAMEDGVVLKDGWHQLDGNWYFFDAGGNNYRKRWYVDNNQERYYLDEDGVLQDDGWFKIENTNSQTGAVTESWYYAQESGAVLKGGYKMIEDKKYYFDNNGYNYRKRWMTGEDFRRYLGDDGTLKANEWFSISGTDSRDAEYTNWYYAGSDGNVYMDGWFKIDGKHYCFNTSGVMRTGWLTEEADEDDEEDSYYYCGEDGARATGWQWLKIPDTWSDDDDDDVIEYIHEHGDYAWFYFHESSGRKRRSSGGRKEMAVNGTTYCFDDDGIMHYGWVKTGSGSPEIRGYRYFYEPVSENDKTFTEGEKVESAWLKIPGPADVDGSGTEEWFYFDNNGRPVCGLENGYEVRRIQGDYYVFNMYGEAQYGLVDVDGDFYYCGPADGDRKCATGKVMVEDGIDSGKTQYCFDSNGKGITGIKDNHFYYKGRLQTADKGSKYQVFDVPGTGLRLINSSGKVMKNTTVKDGDYQEWEIGSGGKIREFGSDEVAEIVAPEATVSY